MQNRSNKPGKFIVSPEKHAERNRDERGSHRVSPERRAAHERDMALAQAHKASREAPTLPPVDSSVRERMPKGWDCLFLKPRPSAVDGDPGVGWRARAPGGTLLPLVPTRGEAIDLAWRVVDRAETIVESGGGEA